MTKPSGREKQITLLVLVFCLFLAAVIRLQVILASPYLLNDGMLFVTMTEDLQAANYRIPEFTTYNQADQIPFAYPPLAFAVTGVINQLAGVPVLELVRWLPFIFNMLSILPLYFLSRRILGGQVKPLFATLAYATLKPGYYWLIMGGGLTRSLGMLFGLTTLVLFWDALQSRRWFSGRLIAVGVCFGLTGASHIEIVMLTAAVLGLFCCFHKGFWRSIARVTVVGMLGLLVAAPYWVQVLHFHGLQPFLAASGSGNMFSIGIIPLLIGEQVIDEPYMTMFGVLLLIGTGALLLRRQYLLLAWILVILVIGYRSLARSSLVPAAMITAVAIQDVLIPAFERIQKEVQRKNKNSQYRYPLAFLIPIIIFIQAFGASFLFNIRHQADLVVPEGTVAALQWVSENTPANANFVVMPSADGWWEDSTQEWFPTMAKRHSLTTVQGYEWLGTMQQRTDLSRDLFMGAFEDDPQKFQVALHRAGGSCDYILFDFHYMLLRIGPKLDRWLNQTHTIVHQQDQVVIYQRNKP